MDNRTPGWSRPRTRTGSRTDRNQAGSPTLGDSAETCGKHLYVIRYRPGLRSSPSSSQSPTPYRTRFCSSIKGQDKSREPNPEQRRRWKKFSLSEQKIHPPPTALSSLPGHETGEHYWISGPRLQPIRRLVLAKDLRRRTE